ncbi:MAG: ATP-binding cassette domain-containing protein [Dehalococcoidia bacterium]|jgi:ABC-2 type transport system ATP-binding protein
MKEPSAIITQNLTKKYGKIVALDNLNLTIQYSEIFGLLGPNGAGKTTAISMLCTINAPTAGTALVNGFDIIKQPDKVRRSIGIVFQDPSIQFDKYVKRRCLDSYIQPASRVHR